MKHYKILKLILNRIKDENFTWRVEGSLNLVLQGINVKVKDIDIATDKKGIKTFREKLNEFIVKDFYKKKINAQTILCKIEGCEVEILQRDNKNLDMFDKIKIINWKKLEIPILPLTSAKKFYSLIGKKEKVEIIKDYLKKGSTSEYKQIILAAS